MLSTVRLLVMAAALSQSPPEPAYLKVLPADTEVVVHLKAATGTRDDLNAMLKAMSPTLSQMTEPQINQAIDQMTQHLGEKAANSPFVIAAKLPAPEDLQGGPPAMVVIVPTDNYEGVLKSVAGKPDAKIEKQDGLDVVEGDEKFYAYKGEGWVALAPGKPDMVKAVASKPTETLDKKLNDAVEKTLFSGDVGLYVDLAAAQSRYDEQIKQAREQLMAVLDQVGGQMPNKEQMEQAKQVYGLMFDALKQAEALTLAVDFDAKAFDLKGVLTVKPDSEAAKTLKTAKLGDASIVGKLPAGELAYMYVNFDPAGMEGLARMNFQSFGQGGANTDAAKKALERMKAAGRQETVGAFSLGKPVSMLSLTNSENAPAESAEQTVEQIKASGVFKDVKLEKNAFEYEGFKFSKAVMTFDIDKMLEAQGQAGGPAAEMMKKMFGDGTMTTYNGTKDKQAVTIIAKDDAEAKAKLDALLGSGDGIGQAAGFQQVRDMLPKQVGGLVLFNAQEIVKQAARLIGSLTGAEVPTPNMPKDTALFGGSFAATPDGYTFELAVPSAVGPVFEQGFGALMQAVQGQVGQ